MKKVKLLAVFISILFLGCQPKEQENTCTISGKIISRPQSKNLKLLKYFDNFRLDSAVTIPIKNHKFSYTFKYKQTEAYMLVFEEEINRGTFKPITFFPSQKVFFEINDKKSFTKNKIEGGKLNKAYYNTTKYYSKEREKLSKKVKKQTQELQKSGNYKSKEMQKLTKSYRNEKNEEKKKEILKEIVLLQKKGLHLSKEFREIKKKRLAIDKEIGNRTIEYVEKEITIPNYFILTNLINTYRQHLNDNLTSSPYNLKDLKKAQNKYVKKFKNHPYTKKNNQIIWTLSNIKKGGKYYDFTLKNMEGKSFTLSKMINGKYALIDIWAPWCSPCIKGSIAMKPIFEQYKDKGFTVVGVASKYKKIKNVKNRLKKDKYPWITLIDKGGKHSNVNIYYGTENAGGKTVLVDDKGVIIAIEPTKEEIKAILKKNLK